MNTMNKANQAQIDIILGCTHPKTNEVTLHDRKEKISCCCECWNKSVEVFREIRKAEKALQRKEEHEALPAVMKKYDVDYGDTVVKWTGGYLPGTGIRKTGVVFKKSGVPYVRIGPKSVRWDSSWKPVGGKP
jgi:hypothetical protein